MKEPGLGSGFFMSGSLAPRHKPRHAVQMTEKDLTSGLEKAYALDSADAVRDLYRDWAVSYDADFVERLGYIYPRLVAEVYAAQAGGGDRPVLDIGCGSGAVAEAMAGDLAVDGLDLSPEMLAVAGAKGIYRGLIEGDLLAALPIADASYGGLVSAGTFTHGHVGPQALPELLRVAKPGALFCLGINAQHFAAHGFGDAFDGLAAAGEIVGLRYEDRPIYAGEAHDHAGDRALIAVFRRG